MKLGDGTPEGKKQQITAIVAIVVILLAIGLLARNFIGGSGGGSTVPTSGPPMAVPPGEELAGGQTSGPPPGAPPGAPPSEAVPPLPTGAAPGAAGQHAAAGDQSPDAAPSEPPMALNKASAPAPAKQPAGGSSPVPAAAMRQMKVFGSVNVSYPAKWKIDAGAANTSAVFTDGNARFAVHPPDPKADSGKKIAQLAMQKITPGAVVVNEGTDKVSGHDAYWYAIKYQGKIARVVGIDGPTRIAVVETVKSGDFGKYRDTFNRLQSGITFAGP